MQKTIFAYISSALAITVLAAAGFTALLHNAADLPLLVVLLALGAGLAAGYPLSKRLAARLAAPLNSLDIEQLDSIDSRAYDEFAPLLLRLTRWQRQQAVLLTQMENRAGTVQAVIGQMHEGLIVLDGQGRILYANASALAIFGAAEATGMSMPQLCRDIELTRKVRQCLNGSGAELLFTREARLYNIYFDPVRQQGELSGAILLFFDITEQYRAEQQRREFSANVSHELKTPLTTISGLAELIENGMAKEEDIPAFAEKIGGQARRLIDIIEDVIRLSEFDEGVVRKEFTRFSLHKVAGAVLASLADKAVQKQVTLMLSGEDLTLTANKRMIDELLYNLVDNAIKYNRPGGRVIVSGRAEGDYVKIAVADSGIGVAPRHTERVFERFYRVDASRSPKTGGTGLGLAIVKHIAEHHQGRVEMISAEGEGSTVNCYIKKAKGQNALANKL